MRAQWVILLALATSPAGADWNSEAGLEGRWHWQQPLDPRQSDSSLSLDFQTEYYTSWDGGDQGFAFKPFARLDGNGNDRTHADIREAVWIRAGDDWEVRVGIDKVFWGVTEVNHLVDIINQTDNLENPDGEQKLGQPMLKYSTEQAWGTLDAYLLPWFRERRFPGSEGRLRPALVVDESQVRYDTKLKQHYPSVALRWSRVLGDWDIGVAHFHGTSRDPRLTQGSDGGGNPVLVPNYDIIDQTSVDLQGTLEDWLWKFEAAYRSGSGKGYLAATGGFEYTLVGIADSDADLGLLLEVMFDDRGDSASTPFNHDLFLGLRWVANDVDGSEVLGGVMVDWKNGGRFLNLEASRRLGSGWKAALQLRSWIDQDQSDAAYALRRDDYLEARLIRYF